MSGFSHQGHVYFAACGRYVKIGFTTQNPPTLRLKSLPGKVRVPSDFDYADTVWMLHTIPGCLMRDERRLHGLFAAHREPMITAATASAEATDRLAAAIDRLAAAQEQANELAGVSV